MNGLINSPAVHFYIQNDYKTLRKQVNHFVIYRNIKLIKLSINFKATVLVVQEWVSVENFISC